MTKIELPRQEADALLERVRTGATTEAGHDKLKAIIETLGYVTDLVADKETKIRQLRQLLLGFSNFPRTTEKTKDVLENAADGEDTASGHAAQSESAPAEEETRSKAAGHGRNGAADYEAAQKVVVTHPDLKHGDPCPECPKGKVYAQKDPAQLVRITAGSAASNGVMSWSGCGATCVGKCSRHRRRNRLGRTSTTKRRWRWWRR